MTKQNFIIGDVLVCFFSFFFFLAYSFQYPLPKGFGAGIDLHYYLFFPQNESEDIVYKTRLQRLSGSIELPYNSSIRKQINKYLKYRKLEISRWIGVSNFYFPIILRIMEFHHIPSELVYLTLIESSLNPSIFSPSGGTSGLWQFTTTTGKLYGLKINQQVDERKDIVKSTEAVCHYFKKLHRIYNNWIITIAVYNCGDKNVQKAILKAHNHTDYQFISNYLPVYTQNYISRFIALNYIMNYYGFHKIEPLMYEYQTVVSIKTEANQTKFRICPDQISIVIQANNFLVHQKTKFIIYKKFHSKELSYYHLPLLKSSSLIVKKHSQSSC